MSIESFSRNFPDARSVERAFCPYRICPIGAHSDHQMGKITGLAIDKGISMYYSPTEDGSIELCSENFDGKKAFSAIDPPILCADDWADYLRGATASLARGRSLTRGLKGQIEGTLPVGGLSSSAAVIITFLQALCKVNDIILTREEMIDTALWAENGFVGVSCGKLDQSCEVYSRKDHLLYLDTQNGQYELIPTHPDMPPYKIAILFSGVERTLAGSKFNMRVDECHAAAYALKAFSGMEYGKFNKTYLRDVPREVFEKYKNRLPENWRRRAEHWYTELERVEEGVKAWRRGDLAAFGKLSFDSGHSSIYNYETGSPELKLIYELLRKTDGVYGGRFSGAGFKGCCMALVDPRFEESIKEKITKEYTAAFPQLKDRFLVTYCQSADGVDFAK